MTRFEYKDGCLRCNECGRLHEPVQANDPSPCACPCGNSEQLDARDYLAGLYNRQPDDDAGPPPEPAAER